MTSGRRARAHRRLRQRFEPEGFMVLAGWCKAASDLEAIRQQTHDRLIALMGDSRVGGVRWRWYTGPEAETALGRLQSPDHGPLTEELSNYYRQLRAHLREYGGFIMVAMAPIANETVAGADLPQSRPSAEGETSTGEALGGDDSPGADGRGVDKIATDEA